MKSSRLILIALLIASTTSVFAQSESFSVLREKFREDNEVHSFKVSGFLCRTVLLFAGEWEFRDAISDVSSIRLIVIPRESLKTQKLSVSGFKKVLRADHFQSLISVKDPGELVEIYIQETGNRKDRYLVLVEEREQVTVIEIKGYIDIQKLQEIEKDEEGIVGL